MKVVTIFYIGVSVRLLMVKFKTPIGQVTLLLSKRGQHSKENNCLTFRLVLCYKIWYATLWNVKYGFDVLLLSSHTTHANKVNDFISLLLALVDKYYVCIILYIVCFILCFWSTSRQHKLLVCYGGLQWDKHSLCRVMSLSNALIFIQTPVLDHVNRGIPFIHDEFNNPYKMAAALC